MTGAGRLPTTLVNWCGSTAHRPSQAAVRAKREQRKADEMAELNSVGVPLRRL